MPSGKASTVAALPLLTKWKCATSGIAMPHSRDRERQVMALVVSGLFNKQVGGELGISEITVKAHRGQVMRKMQAQSFADLVMIAR